MQQQEWKNNERKPTKEKTIYGNRSYLLLYYIIDKNI